MKYFFHLTLWMLIGVLKKHLKGTVTISGAQNKNLRNAITISTVILRSVFTTVTHKHCLKRIIIKIYKRG